MLYGFISFNGQRQLLKHSTMEVLVFPIHAPSSLKSIPRLSIMRNNERISIEITQRAGGDAVSESYVRSGPRDRLGQQPGDN